MSDRQARAQHRTMAPIEQEQPAGGVVIQGVRQMPPDPLRRPEAAEAFAFQVQEGDFIERVERPQLWIEFQTVDDRDGFAEPNMFGAQVPMCVDKTPRANPPKQQGGAPGGKLALHLCDPLHSTMRKAEAAVEQNAAIVSQGSLPSDNIALGTKGDARRVRVERTQRRGEPINL